MVQLLEGFGGATEGVVSVVFPPLEYEGGIRPFLLLVLPPLLFPLFLLPLLLLLVVL
jgi:hypothetical protein